MAANFDARKQKQSWDALYLIWRRPNSQKPLELYYKKTHHFGDGVRYIRRDISVLHFRGHVRPLTFLNLLTFAWIWEPQRTTEKYGTCNSSCCLNLYFSSQLHYECHFSCLWWLKKNKKANLIFTENSKTISKAFKVNYHWLCYVTLPYILMNCKWQ